MTGIWTRHKRRRLEDHGKYTHFERARVKSFSHLFLPQAALNTTAQPKPASQ